MFPASFPSIESAPCVTLTYRELLSCRTKVIGESDRDKSHDLTKQPPFMHGSEAPGQDRRHEIPRLFPRYTFCAAGLTIVSLSCSQVLRSVQQHYGDDFPKLLRVDSICAEHKKLPCSRRSR